MINLIQAVGALIFVLALIALVAWLMRRYGPAMRLGRPGRLGVVESIALDNRHRLLLVRRDNVEHLLLLGTAGDLVVESGIIPGTTPSPTRRSEPSFASHLQGEQP